MHPASIGNVPAETESNIAPSELVLADTRKKLSMHNMQATLSHNCICWLCAVLPLLSLNAFAQERQTNTTETESLRQSILAIENDLMRLSFSGSEQGFDCSGIVHLETPKQRFVHSRSTAPGLWEIEFRTLPCSLGQVDTPILLNNKDAGQGFVNLVHQPNGIRTLTFTWKNLDLPEESGSVDVSASVRLMSGQGQSEWRITVVNRSKKLGVWKVRYPILAEVFTPGTGDVISPKANWGGRLVKNNFRSIELTYPRTHCQMQYITALLKGTGLYFAAHDPSGFRKGLSVSAEQDFSFIHYPKNMGVPGTGYKSPYPVVLQTFTGNWWQAAKLYRSWATANADWTRKGPIAQRTDYPKSLCNVGVWMLLGHDILDKARKAASLFDVPIAIHWYHWHKHPFDIQYPDYFPAKPYVAETIKELTGMGQLIMPYINGKSWSMDEAGFPSVRYAAAKQSDGALHMQRFSKKPPFASMCPTQQIWQDRLFSIVSRLIHEYGANGIYLDQLGGSLACRCFDKTHGHTMGGGDYWVKGYRELVSRMRHITVPKNIPITTENAAEPYMDFVDGFLTWGDIREGEVPALAAVYSGYTIYFSSLVDRKTDVNSFFMRQARDMLWGSQPGWTREYILEEEFREHAKLLNMLCLYRLALKRFLIYGELMDEIRPLNEIPTIQGHWYSRRTKRFLTLDWPGVMGVVWKAPDDSLLALMANYSSEPQQFEYKLSLTKYAGVTDSTTPWTVFSVTPSGRTPLEHVTGDWIKREELLPPRGIRAIVIQPTNKTMPSERYPQKNR